MSDPFDKTVSAEIAGFKARVLRLIDEDAASFEFEADQLAHCTTRECRVASKATKAAALALRDLREEVGKL